MFERLLVTVGPYVLVALVLSNLFFIGLWRLKAEEAETQAIQTELCHTQFSTFKESVRVEGEKARERHDLVLANNKRDQEKAQKTYEDNLTRVRNDAARRMRHQYASSCGGGVPDDTRPAGGLEDSSTDAIPAPERLAADCAETTLKANGLQSFYESIQHNLKGAP